jgi:proteasome lid subunit RPN8/RPN11
VVPVAIKVITSEKAWRDFVRRAKRVFPQEYINAIWGEETVDSFRVTDFIRMRLNTGSTKTINYDDTELKRQKWLAEKAGKMLLGTVHTHPYASSDSAASAVDHHEAAKDGEKVMGVLVLYKKDDRFKEEVDWWIPQRKIDFVRLPE